MSLVSPKVCHLVAFVWVVLLACAWGNLDLRWKVGGAGSRAWLLQFQAVGCLFSLPGTKEGAACTRGPSLVRMLICPRAWDGSCYNHSDFMTLKSLPTTRNQRFSFLSCYFINPFDDTMEIQGSPPPWQLLFGGTLSLTLGTRPQLVLVSRRTVNALEPEVGAGEWQEAMVSGGFPGQKWGLQGEGHRQGKGSLLILTEAFPPRTGRRSLRALPLSLEAFAHWHSLMLHGVGLWARRFSESPLLERLQLLAAANIWLAVH